MNICIKPSTIFQAASWHSSVEKYTWKDVFKKNEVIIPISQVKRCVKTKDCYLIFFVTNKLNFVTTSQLPDELKSIKLELSSYLSSILPSLRTLLTYKSLTFFYVVLLTIFYQIIISTKHLIPYNVHIVKYSALIFTFFYAQLHWAIFSKKTSHVLLFKIMYYEKSFYSVGAILFLFFGFVFGKI